MDVKDLGVVISGITRKGYQDFHEARAKYVWPMSRYDSNRTFQTAMELMGRVGFDFAGLNRDCRIRINFPDESGLFSHRFSPIYTVSWFLKTNTVLVDANEIVASIEFIEPLKRIRHVGLTSLLPDSRHNLRKPAERIDFMVLLTPENTREAVLNEVEMATNYVTRIEDLRRGGLPESELRRVWLDYTNAPFPTNVLAAPKSE